MNKKYGYTLLSVILFIMYFVLWLSIQFFTRTTDGPLNYLYADSYGVTAALGGILGIFIAHRWGSYKSYVGSAVLYLSAGLLFQFLGQLSYTIIFYVYHIENAYPSFGEIFYFGSIPLYIMGLSYIAKASGFGLSKKSYKNSLPAIIIPVIMIFISYYAFLRGYETEGLTWAEILLDHAYPIGQALFVSFAIVIFLKTKDVLGGVMRGRVMFILFSLIFQFVADTMFIYETRTDLWYAGGLSDLMFLISYFLMSIALFQFEAGDISNIVKNYNKSKVDSPKK